MNYLVPFIVFMTIVGGGITVVVLTGLIRELRKGPVQELENFELRKGEWAEEEIALASHLVAFKREESLSDSAIEDLSLRLNRAESSVRSKIKNLRCIIDENSTVKVPQKHIDIYYEVAEIPSNLIEIYVKDWERLLLSELEQLSEL